MNLHLEASPLHELSPLQLHKLYKLRVDVFVVEQECPYEEIDDADASPEMLHLRYLNEDDDLVGCARLFPTPDKPNDVHLGRLIIREDVRGSGQGRALVQACMDYAREHFPGYSMTLEGQARLQDFYESLGFEACGPMYLDTGIPHVPMTQKL